MRKFIMKFSTLTMITIILAIPSAMVFAGDKQSVSDDVQNKEIVTIGIENSSKDGENSVEPYWFFTKTYVVTGDRVNIRVKPTTNSDSVGVLYKGDTIEVKSIDNGWAKFKYNDQWRYISSKYVKEKS